MAFDFRACPTNAAAFCWSAHTTRSTQRQEGDHPLKIEEPLNDDLRSYHRRQLASASPN